MSIIFQLFSAEDLKNLNESELDKLREIIGTVADEAKSPPVIKHARTRRLPIVLGEAQTTQKELANAAGDAARLAERQLENFRRDITDTCRKRAREVFQQLTLQQPGDAPGPDRLDLIPLDLSKSEDEVWRDFRPQLLNGDDLRRLDSLDNLDNSRNKILNFALACEIDNFIFYYGLRLVRDSVRANDGSPFQGQRLKDPDSRYSLLNPDHPLYPDR